MIYIYVCAYIYTQTHNTYIYIYLCDTYIYLYIYIHTHILSIFKFFPLIIMIQRQQQGPVFCMASNINFWYPGKIYLSLMNIKWTWFLRHGVHCACLYKKVHSPDKTLKILVSHEDLSKIN